MATLQNIRSKGPLLVIVIGLALFAFIAGDAWKVLQPHQSHDVGEVNGDALSAQDYQALVEEYTDIIKFSSGTTSLSDDQTNQVKDEVWRTYVNNKLLENEAKKLGLTVSKAEIQAIIDAGVHPLLQQTPFRNPQSMINNYKNLIRTTAGGRGKYTLLTITRRKNQCYKSHTEEKQILLHIDHFLCFYKTTTSSYIFIR